MCTTEDNARGRKTVELFVPGLTYDHTYFNSPYQPNTYSYVYAATSRGYSTFNLDRLGTGLSDHPPGDRLTVQSHAYVIGQVIQMLRAGAVRGRAFTTVVGVGQSFGSAILQYLTATATDRTTVPDYLVLGSFLFTTYAPGSTRLTNSLYTASSDPRFSATGLGVEYLTTQPGTRGTSFYNTASAEAAMITQDEATKQTGTTGERASIPVARDLAITRAISVPVLIVVGQYDNLYCDEASGLSCATSAVMVNREGPNYSARACLSAYVVVDAGHSVGGHIKARDSYNFAHNWVDKYTLAASGSKDANGCLP